MLTSEEHTHLAQEWLRLNALLASQQSSDADEGGVAASEAILERLDEIEFMLGQDMLAELAAARSSARNQNIQR